MSEYAIRVEHLSKRYRIGERERYRALRDDYSGELIVIWDNAPVHHGPALREYLATPHFQLCLIALPAYSPDYNPAEELWKWLRDDVTANTCFGTGAKVAAAVWDFLLGLNDRLDDVKQRCQNDYAE